MFTPVIKSAALTAIGENSSSTKPTIITVLRRGNVESCGVRTHLLPPLELGGAFRPPPTSRDIPQSDQIAAKSAEPVDIGLRTEGAQRIG
jgi:hypothetical protein